MENFVKFISTADKFYPCQPDVKVFGCFDDNENDLDFKQLGVSPRYVILHSKINILIFL